MASIGTIVTRVYTSRAQLPVPGATVAVTQISFLMEIQVKCG